MFRSINKKQFLLLVFAAVSVLFLSAFADTEKMAPLLETWQNHHARIVFDGTNTLHIDLKLLPSKSGSYVY